MADDRLKGLRKGLTSYGDPAFSLFLRKVFIKAAGYSDDALDRQPGESASDRAPGGRGQT